MIETLSFLPFSFWAGVALIVFGAYWATGRLHDGLGLPVMTVLGTVATWYLGDALYNDYRHVYMAEFTPNVLDEAWWQVALFLLVFLVLAPIVHRWINAREIRHSSQIFQMLRHGSGQPVFQFRLQQMLWACVGLWAFLTIIAAFRLGDQTPYYIFPFLSDRADPWSRDRIGSGIDALISLAGYLEMFVAGVFGTTAALLQDRRLRALALLGCVVTWPYFIFDRTRNPMLAVVVPTVLAWVFLRLRGSPTKKVLVLAACFCVINAWFGFVMTNRASTSIASAFGDEGFNFRQNASVHHEGLNMYEELCWINTLMECGAYRPNWGERYYAELVNPIPRTLWPDKPMIGIDYAIARGQSFDGGSAGVAATVSTGMVGQGVVNFGVVVGPAFAAFLMSVWAAVLARLDLQGQEVGRIPLYGLGLILTFNLGRDITLITLYTFVFGAVVVWWLERQKKRPPKKAIVAPRARALDEKITAPSFPGQAGPGQSGQLRLSTPAKSRL